MTSASSTSGFVLMRAYGAVMLGMQKFITMNCSILYGNRPVHRGIKRMRRMIFYSTRIMV